MRGKTRFSMRGAVLLGFYFLVFALNEGVGQIVDRRDIGDVVFTSQASTSHCSSIGGYCDWSSGSCDSCFCNFRQTYSSLSQRCEEYYTGKFFQQMVLRSLLCSLV